MSFLTGVEIRRRIKAGDIEIHSLDSNEPFNLDAQVTEDCIDLRLAPTALSLRADIDHLDYLQHDLDGAYEQVEIPARGFELLPLQPLITQTLEAVCLPKDLIGLVFTRSTFARMGLMVNCMAPKFAIGIRWAFPLQLVNLTRTPVHIYPYAPVAQLLLSEVSGEPVAYHGKFMDTYTPTPPRISDRERLTLSALNPDAVNRTFHIINREKLLGAAQSGASTAGEVSTGAVPDREPDKPLLRHPPTTSSTRLWHRASVSLLAVLSALGFGICGNLLAAGSISYWQGVSIVLLAVVSSMLGGAGYLLQIFWTKRAAILE